MMRNKDNITYARVVMLTTREHCTPIVVYYEAGPRMDVAYYAGSDLLLKLL